MIDLITNIKYRKFSNAFQDQLKDDILKISKSNRIIVQADNTANMYKLSKEEYERLLLNNINGEYKKASLEMVDGINEEAQKLATDLELQDRINILAEKDAYITLKDHKENFRSRPRCRLLNLTKSEIGKISKIILENLNVQCRRKTRSNQWTDTEGVIEWFNKINNKSELHFIKFDVVSFYPSITEALLREAIEFAKQFEAIPDSDINIIMNASKSVLFHQGEPWVKREKNNCSPTFDITMGCSCYVQWCRGM